MKRDVKKARAPEPRAEAPWVQLQPPRRGRDGQVRESRSVM